MSCNFSYIPGPQTPRIRDQQQPMYSLYYVYIVFIYITEDKIYSSIANVRQSVLTVNFYTLSRIRPFVSDCMNIISVCLFAFMQKYVSLGYVCHLFRRGERFVHLLGNTHAINICFYICDPFCDTLIIILLWKMKTLRFPRFNPREANESSAAWCSLPQIKSKISLDGTFNIDYYCAAFRTYFLHM